MIRNWFFIGRGIYYGLALEAALKFKEVTYSHAEGMPAGFLKHGTISLIDDAMHTAIFLPGKEDPELRTQMAIRGRRTVEQYRWEIVSRQVMDYYLHLLESTNGLSGKRKT